MDVLGLGLLGLGSLLGLGLPVALLLALGDADAELCPGEVRIIGVLTGLGLRLEVGLEVGLVCARGLAVLVAAVLAGASDDAELASMSSPPLGRRPVGAWPAGAWPARAAVT